MGAVEETRKMVQDFLAPELREIKARLEALEATTKLRFDAVQVQFASLEETMKARFDAVQVQFASLEGTMNARFDTQDKIMAAQHAAVMSALTNLTNYSALAERLSKLESERGQQAH
jgi:hypothetical protein